jgi:hypothetical protein
LDKWVSPCPFSASANPMRGDSPSSVGYSHCAPCICAHRF